MAQPSINKNPKLLKDSTITTLNFIVRVELSIKAKKTD